MIISSNPDKLVIVLQQGGVIAYPTEAVFGLGCDPLNKTAVMRLLALKQREVEKGLILIASDFSQLESFLKPLNSQQQQFTEPSETTWVFPARDEAPDWLTGRFDSLAVRITKHEPVRELCELYGSALVSTSANISGHVPAINRDTVVTQFHHYLDGIYDAPLGHLSKPTQIRDSLTGKVLRS